MADPTLSELIAQLEAAAPSARKLREEIEGVSTALLEQAESRAGLDASIGRAIDRQLRKRNENLELLERENELAQERFDTEKDIAKQYKIAEEVNNTRIAQLEKELEYLSREEDAYDEILDKIKKLKKANKDLTEAGDEYNKSLQEAKQTVEEFEGGLKSIASGDFI